MAITSLSSGWNISDSEYNSANNTIGTSPVNRSYCYVCSYNGDAVYVIDPTTNTITNTISTGTLSNATDCCITPDGRYVYATLYGTGEVVVISTATNTIVSTITTAAGCWQIIMSPNGQYCYAVNRTGGTISVISTATNTVVHTITMPSGASPIPIDISPNGRYIYVGDTSTANLVYIYDTITYAQVNTINTGNPTSALGVSLDGKYLITCYDNGSSSVANIYNTSTLSLVHSFTAGAVNSANNMAFSQNGRYCYIVSNLSGYTVIDLMNLTATFVSNAGGGGAAAAITPDGLYLYITYNATNNIIIHRTLDNSLYGSISGTTDPNGILFMPQFYIAQESNLIPSLNPNINTTTNIATLAGTATIAGTATTVSVGASPYTYTNSSASNQQVFIQGGTVSAISFNPNGVSGINLSGLTDNVITMRPNDTLTITYTAAPTVTTIQL